MTQNLDIVKGAMKLLPLTVLIICLTACGVSDSPKETIAGQPGVTEHDAWRDPNAVKQLPADCYYKRRIPECGKDEPF